MISRRGTHLEGSEGLIAKKPHELDGRVVIDSKRHAYEDEVMNSEEWHQDQRRLCPFSADTGEISASIET